MAYAFNPHRTIADEVKRIADTQLAFALQHLQPAGSARADEAIHEARRHLKKVQALLRLLKPVFAGDYRGAARRVRTAIRRLGPVADARAIIHTVERLAAHAPDARAAAAAAALHEALLLRASGIDRKLQVDRVVPRVSRAVSLERTRVESWMIEADGLRAVAPGLTRAARRARRAMARARTAPTRRHYEAWRGRVRTLWLAVRLLERQCSRAFDADRRHLAALDECLGEYHSVLLLQRILKDECLVWRGDTTRLMKWLRHDLVALRRRAERLGQQALGERERAFQARVRDGWLRTPREHRIAGRRARHAARRSAARTPSGGRHRRAGDRLAARNRDERRRNRGQRQDVVGGARL